MTSMVCIWFPQWPLQHALWKRPELKGQPFVVLHSPVTARGARVVDCSLAAWRCGVRVGMPLAEAQALPLECAALQSDPAAARAGLRELAGCCQEYTPLYGVEEVESPECLLLDVTGSANLFGGEQALAERVRADFQERGWQVRVAIAPTIGAAWAVAHGVSRPNQAVVVPAAGLEETLGGLPIHVLRLPDEIVRSLGELGIHGVGQLLRLPRDRLPSRFGPLILRRLDQAFGNVQELIVVEHPAEPIVATWAAQEAFLDRRVLLEVCRQLLVRMLAPLQTRRWGVRRLLCQLQGCGGRPWELSVGTVSPTNSATHLQELLELQLERFVWEDEITFVRLEAVEVTSLEERPRDLFGEQFDADHTRELGRLLERLSSRLGTGAVVRATCVPDAQPELAVAYQPWITDCTIRGGPSSQVETAGGASRPLRLFAPPQRIDVCRLLTEPQGVPGRFVWEQRDYQVRQAWGPERIETGWWRGNHVRRDYYCIEVTSGERYWLFHAADGWFVHGVFE
jgi:protein ImuB